MRCHTCGYVLFNLRKPVCPECGNGYDIRTYKFAKDTVAFACPHCDKLHEGWGDQYLPEMTEVFTCYACHRTVRVAGMRVVPLVPPDRVAGILETRVPWEERQRFGRIRAWWKTLVMGTFRPGEVGRRIDANTSVWQAYKFAVWALLPVAILCCALVALVVLMIFALLAMMLMMSSGGPHAGVNGFVAMCVLAVVLSLPISALLAPLYVILFIACPAHFFLWMFGKTKQRLRATVAGCLYTTGPMALLLMSVLGYYALGIVQIWPSISATIAIRNIHKTSGLWATLAAWWFSVSLLAVWVVLRALGH